MMTKEQKEKEVKAHACRCLRCLDVTVRYAGKIDLAIHEEALSDAVASEIRAQLCKVGARIFDRIMGVSS